MNNRDGNSNLRNKENICSICKCEKAPINISKIKEIKLKQIISKITKKEPDTSTLITKCNCKNNNKKVHKICLLLNIIFNFDLNCKECKANYNLSISKNLNTYKRFSKLCSLISLSLFHICIYAGAIFLILYLHLINKNLKNDFEEHKFLHTYYFFAGVIFILNTFTISVTLAKFLDKNDRDIFDYNIDIKDISEEKKNNNNTDDYYRILYRYFRFFYNTQIRYLIEKKQKITYISRGFCGYNKDLMDIINKNNKECKEEILFNNGGEEVLNLNKKSKEKIKNDNTNIINNNAQEQSNGIINNNMFESFKKASPKKEEEEEKNNSNNSNKERKKDKLISLSEKKSEQSDTNPINLDNSKTKKNNIIINEPPREENLNINNKNIEKEKQEEEKKNKINNDIIEKENKLNDEKNNKTKNVNMSYNSEIFNNKKGKNIAKTYFYKKIDSNNLLGKSKTIIINPEKRNKKNKNEKKKEKKRKIRIHIEEKKYADSTSLAQSEKEEKFQNDEKLTSKNEIIEEEPFNMNVTLPLHNNGK